VFLLVPAHPGSPGQRAVKRLLLLLLKESNIASVRSPVMDEERMRLASDFPWLGSVLFCFLYCFDRRWSLETRVVSADCLHTCFFHLSVLAVARHLFILSWLCLRFPCLVMSYDCVSTML